MSITPDPVAILQELIRCPSVTPAEAGVLDYMERLMVPAGFAASRMPFSEEGTADVDNLFLRLGDAGPHFCFAGHVDVVPPGADSLWSHPPFAAEIHDGVIYGRGACDMKGSVAAFCAAAIGFAKDHDGKLPGTVSLLITGDEEGIAINGTVKMLAEIKRRSEVPDVCLVGEPTCPDTFGDTLKIGRRGSIHFRDHLDRRPGALGLSAQGGQPDHPAGTADRPGGSARARQGQRPLRPVDAGRDQLRHRQPGQQRDPGLGQRALQHPLQYRAHGSQPQGLG
jgi:succinyl-diaminopimelate desuccinylase